MDDIIERRLKRAAVRLRVLDECHRLLADALHAHKRGDKPHVVTDHLERAIDAIATAMAD
jgi:hypothetical protein